MGSANYREPPIEEGENAHSVTLSSYYIGQTEVTQALWEVVMGTTALQHFKRLDEFYRYGSLSRNSYGKGPNFPMHYISWEECQEFIRKLNSLTGLRFRLPTEAEWEFAARGGTKSRDYIYSGSDSPDEVAWSNENTNGAPHRVSKLRANELGLYDMSGNVEEWCQDWYGSYSSSAQTNPTGSASGSERVIRGGDFLYPPYTLGRVSYRNHLPPSKCDQSLGLRLAISELDAEASIK
ncbi:MAG: formylglycine-generating enzyme family protein [Bacteroidaceae bacterium]|nr:formylglycine-generating enzyme family protein [Bacteroidaceae bacterium]